MNFRKIGLGIMLVLLVGLYFLNRTDLKLSGQSAFTATPIGTAGYELNSVITVQNPNLLSSTIKEISEKFYLEGREVAVLKIELERGIPGLKETAFPVSVRFSKSDLAKFAGNDTTRRILNAEVLVTGQISFQNLMSSGTTIVNQKDSVSIPLF